MKTLCVSIIMLVVLLTISKTISAQNVDSILAYDSSQSPDYQHHLEANATAEQLQQALTRHIDKWWISSATQYHAEGDTFSLHFQGTYKHFRIAEYIPFRKIVWECIDVYLNIPTLTDKKEWIGTRIIWEFEQTPKALSIQLTHEGLNPTMECYGICEPSWNYFLENSLKPYLETGIGKPFIESEVLSRFHNYVDKGILPGMVTYLEKNGELITDSYGYQDIEHRKPISTNSIFRIASMTKPITSVAIMILVERGLIALDDHAAIYLPDIDQMKLYDGTANGSPPSTKITIRHLLSHTSGITSPLHFSAAGKAAGEMMRKYNPRSQAELADAIIKTPLAFNPGEGWAYGYSHDVLGVIIEQVTGTSLEDFLNENIFIPLNMHHTGYQCEDIEHLTSLYRTAEDQSLQVVGDTKTSSYVNGKNFPRGNGGLVSTAQDYLNYCRMILNNGKFEGKEILSPASIELMKQNQIMPQYLPMMVADNTMHGQGYGLGFGIIMDDAHYGTSGDIYWPGSLFTWFLISPKHNAIAIVMTQLLDRNKMSLIDEFNQLATEYFEDSSR